MTGSLTPPVAKQHGSEDEVAKGVQRRDGAKDSQIWAYIAGGLGMFAAGAAVFAAVRFGTNAGNLIAAGAGAVAAITGAIVAYFTKTLTAVAVRQEEATAKQDKRLDRTVAAMDAQREAMESIATSVEASAAAHRSELRAYLGVSNRWVAPGNDHDQKLWPDNSTGIFVTNNGQTPARGVRFLGGCRILPWLRVEAGELGVADVVEGMMPTQDFIAPRICDPGHGLPLWYKLKCDESRKPVPVDEAVYQLGRISYEDVFGNTHWTTFCAYWNAKEEMWIASTQFNNFGTYPQTAEEG